MSGYNNKSYIQCVLDIILKPQCSQKRLDLAKFVELNTEYIEDQLATIPCALPTPKNPDIIALIERLDSDKFGWLGALTSRYIPGWPSQKSPLKAFQFCLLVNNIKSNLTPFDENLKLKPMIFWTTSRIDVMSLIEALFPEHYSLIRKTWMDFDFPPSVPDCSKSNSHYLIPQASSLEESVQDRDMKMIYIKMCILSQVVDGRADKTWADRVLEVISHDFEETKQKAINAFANIIVSLCLKGYCHPHKARTIERILSANGIYNFHYTINESDVEWLYRFVQAAVRSKDDWNHLIHNFMDIVEPKHFNNVMKWAKNESDFKLQLVHQAYQGNGLFPWDKVEHAYPGQLKIARETYDLRLKEPFSNAYTSNAGIKFFDVAWVSHMLLVAKGSKCMANYKGLNKHDQKDKEKWNTIIQEFVKNDQKMFRTYNNQQILLKI